MEKLKASDVIEIDEEFILNLVEKIQGKLNPKNEKIKSLYSLKEIQKITGKSNNTLLLHVKNYLTNNHHKTHIIAHKIGRDWKVTEENLNKYLNQ